MLHARVLCWVALLATVVGTPWLFAAPPMREEVQPLGGFAKDVPERDLAPMPQRVYLAPKITEPYARAWLQLQKLVKMNFPAPTAFEDVLKYIKEITTENGSKGLRIYVDPVSLQEAEHTLRSEVTIDVEDVPLASALSRILHQLDLGYYVRDDGLLVITLEFFLPDQELPEAVSELVGELESAILSLRTELDALPGRPPVVKPEVKKTRWKGNSQQGRNTLEVLHETPNPCLLRRSLTAAAATTWLQLFTKVDVNFKDTSLADAIRFLSTTNQKGGRKISVYADPVGLRLAEKTLNSTIDLNVEDVSAASVLDMIAKQLGLEYFVADDGFVVITSNLWDGTSTESRDMKTLETLGELRLGVELMQREIAFLRGHQGSTTRRPRGVLPASRVNHR